MIDAPAGVTVDATTVTIPALRVSFAYAEASNDDRVDRFIAWTLAAAGAVSFTNERRRGPMRVRNVTVTVARDEATSLNAWLRELGDHIIIERSGP